MQKEIQLMLLQITNDIILVKSPFGCFFINHSGFQIQDPETHSIMLREKTLYEKYFFLNKKEVHTQHLCDRAKIITERIKYAYLQ